jgi:tetratricopeptide (TPR) repeat protein
VAIVRATRGTQTRSGTATALAVRISAVLLVVACVAAVVGFQATRPRSASGSPAVFVPSPEFFREVSPGFRTFVSDLYWLTTVQYYGEHIKKDGRLDSLPAMLRLVTGLSPHFTRAYLFGAFALLDAGKSQQAYRLLVRGARRNPDDWRLQATVGTFVYSFATNKDKAALAAEWYERAAAVPGHPAYVDRLAATLLQKGGEAEKAATMWAEVYADGDKYSKEKAVTALRQIIAQTVPRNRDAQIAFLTQFQTMMSPIDFQQLLLEVAG